MSTSAQQGPLTLGTAGHIDHGKTALVRALTGVETDRLAEERARGISIELGYAPLTLGSGRRISVVDVPGHERFVRTMVAGATGIDAFLMTVAADDGVMPQTREHAAVLAGLGVSDGVIAITKRDLADPEAAREQTLELLPGCEAVAVSARTGEGLTDLGAALDRLAGQLPGRAATGGAALLHVDRVFTITGAGTVVTGTLWSGSIGRGDELVILPSGQHARVRGVQVHDQALPRAAAGQRVAVNLTKVARAQIARGDVLAAPDGELTPTYILDVALDLHPDSSEPVPGERVQVHHGTREAPARVPWLVGRLCQLRLERPLLARDGDRLILRRIAPPDTLGGGLVLDARARKHGSGTPAIARLERLLRGEAPVPVEPPAPAAEPLSQAPAALSPDALSLEQQLRAAWFEPPGESTLGPDHKAALAELRAAGRAVRVGRSLHYHPEALAEVRRRVVAVIERDGSITLGRLRDELGTSRKFSQALLEHLDADRITRRLPTDERVLRARARERLTQ